MTSIGGTYIYKRFKEEVAADEKELGVHVATEQQ